MTDTPIPQMFWAALDAEPACMTLRCAVADWLEENGDPDGAEAIRWSVEKGRVPFDRGFTCYGVGRQDIPHDLFRAGNGLIDENLMGEGYAKTFVRLIIRWKYTTRKQRDAFWKWEAP